MINRYKFAREVTRIKIKQILLCVLFESFFCGSAIGANVQWNVFTKADMGHWETGMWIIQYRDAGIGFNGDGSVNLASMFGAYSDWGTYWVYASYGEVLAAFSDYQKEALAADYAFTSNELLGGNNLNSMYDEAGKVYLAFLNYESDGFDGRKYYYGWIELQDKTILSSAYSDVPLIVGTGQVIPEPSSALLLVLGCAGLALRRRRLLFQRHSSAGEDEL